MQQFQDRDLINWIQKFGGVNKNVSSWSQNNSNEPLFLQGFFSTTGTLEVENIFKLAFIRIMDLSMQKNYFSELINSRRGPNLI